jgi:hypothetical protein
MANAGRKGKITTNQWLLGGRGTPGRTTNKSHAFCLRVSVAPGLAATEAWELNLLEERQRPIPIGNNGELDMKFAPYEIKTIECHTPTHS